MNEPLPNQLTVGKLRRIIEGAHDNTVVGLHLPPGFRSHPDLGTVWNLDVQYNGGPIVILSPQVIPGEQNESTG